MAEVIALRSKTELKKENPEQVVALYGIDNLATDTDIVWLQ